MLYFSHIGLHKPLYSAGVGLTIPPYINKLSFPSPDTTPHVPEFTGGTAPVVILVVLFKQRTIHFTKSVLKVRLLGVYCKYLYYMIDTVFIIITSNQLLGNRAILQKGHNTLTSSQSQAPVHLIPMYEKII